MKEYCESLFCRLSLLWGHPTPLVHINEKNFNVHPVHSIFEEIGVINQEFVWKLAIKLDVGALEIRFQQL